MPNTASTYTPLHLVPHANPKHTPASTCHGRKTRSRSSRFVIQS